jgi:hypothetical protein
VNCGGDDKERDMRIEEEARRRTGIDLNNHPCGCLFCGAICLLANLRVVRLECGVDPETGRTIRA